MTGQSDGPVLEHRGGVPWWEAPPPRKRHKHWAQTVGWFTLDYVERCACGAIRGRPMGPWVLLDPPRVRLLLMGRLRLTILTLGLLLNMFSAVGITVAGEMTPWWAAVQVVAIVITLGAAYP